MNRFCRAFRYKTGGHLMKKTKIIAAISALTIIFSAAPIQPFYDVISNCEVTANAVAEQFGDYMFDTETGTITKHVGTDEEIESLKKSL